jgi:hypothetical protein
MRQVKRRRGREALLIAAALWSACLLLAAFVLPAYRTVSQTASSPGSEHARSATSTLVAVNGLWVLLPLAVPLLAVAAVAFSLRSRERRGQPTAGFLAWGVIGLLTVLVFLGMASIGVFVLPVVVLLAFACRSANVPDPALTPG